jgi:hypothetical protein
MTLDEIEDVALAIVEFQGDMTDPDWHEGMDCLLLLDRESRDAVLNRATAIRRARNDPLSSLRP